MNSITPLYDTELLCPICGSNNIRTEWRTETFNYGEGTSAAELSAHLPVRHCGACGSEYLDEHAEELRHTAVCRHLQILPPQEIVSIREGYGLSQDEFSRLTRIGRASLTRWENGSIFQNGANDSLLFLLQYAENLDRLRYRFSTEKAISAKRKFRALSAESERSAMNEGKNFSLHETCYV